MSFASTLRPTKSKTTAERILAKGLLERRLGTTRLIDELLALDISLSRALELAQLAAALLIQTKNDGLHLHVLEQSLKLLQLAAAAGVAFDDCIDCLFARLVEEGAGIDAAALEVDEFSSEA